VGISQSWTQSTSVGSFGETSEEVQLDLAASQCAVRQRLSYKLVKRTTRCPMKDLVQYCKMPGHEFAVFPGTDMDYWSGNTAAEFYAKCANSKRVNPSVEKECVPHYSGPNCADKMESCDSAYISNTQETSSSVIVMPIECVPFEAQSVELCSVPASSSTVDNESNSASSVHPSHLLSLSLLLLAAFL
jgi:hypothetical protein